MASAANPSGAPGQLSLVNPNPVNLNPVSPRSSNPWNRWH